MGNKWKLILHEQCEDPYFEITNGPISLCSPAGHVGETEDEEDAIFKKVADALNDSGIDFHSKNALELKQHIEVMKLQAEVERLNKSMAHHMDVFKMITNMPVPATEKEYMSWFVYVKNMAGGVLSDHEAEKYVQQFKDGKRKEDKVYRPCPHCGKELFRDRNLCCRACGEEVNNG